MVVSAEVGTGTGTILGAIIVVGQSMSSRESVDKGCLLFRIEVEKASFVEVSGALDSERAWTAMALR
jgi:hypothetical protein